MEGLTRVAAELPCGRSRLSERTAYAQAWEFQNCLALSSTLISVSGPFPTEDTLRTKWLESITSANAFSSKIATDPPSSVAVPTSPACRSHPSAILKLQHTNYLGDR